MTTLLTGDVHFTDKLSDQYRWGLLPWLAEQAQRHKADQVIILGDCTDAKDRHPAALVTKMVDGLAALAEHCAVYVLKGNHDYIDPTTPFFGFVGKLKGIHFVGVPTEFDAVRIAGVNERCLFLPSAAKPEEEWRGFLGKLDRYRSIFCHQTFLGALRENGTASDTGVSVSVFGPSYKGEIWSGDIHVPQVVGRHRATHVEYVGAPYRIDFGDRFAPRVVLISHAGAHVDLHYPCPTKHLVEISGDGEIGGSEGIREGDQVKVRVTLRRADFPLWPKLQKQIRGMAEKGGWVLFGPELRRMDEQPEAEVAGYEHKTRLQAQRIDPQKLLREFAASAGADDTLTEIGLEILKGHL